MSKIAVIGLAVIAVIVAALYFIFRGGKSSDSIKEGIPTDAASATNAITMAPVSEATLNPIAINTSGFESPQRADVIAISSSSVQSGGAQNAASLPGLTLTGIDRPPVGGIGTSQSTIATAIQTSPKQWDYRGEANDIPASGWTKDGNRIGIGGDSGVDVYVNGEWKDIMYNNSAGNDNPSWSIIRTNPDCVLAAQQAGANPVSCGMWQQLFGVEEGKPWLSPLYGTPEARSLVGKSFSDMVAFFTAQKNMVGD